MRTTITLDEDVAARLERLKKTRPLQAIVNDVLRTSLDEIENKASQPRTRRYSIKPVKGYPRRMDMDNVAELLEEIEGNELK